MPKTLDVLATLPTPTARILLVDDQPSNIQTLYRIFHADYEVFFATSGPEALNFCAETPPDLILMDVIMPGMDGLETCRRLQAQETTQGIPVIFVTAQNEPDDETQAFEAGGVDFISRPINPTVVRARVKTHLTLKAQTDMLKTLVFIDGLTGVANRRRLDEALRMEWRNSQRHAYPLSILMIDIDHFKLYNDYYGHLTGDSCLQAVARCLRKFTQRPHDLVARYGGEEFVCVLPECDAEGARTKAQALCEAIIALKIPHATSPVAPYVTVSIGATTAAPHSEEQAECLLAHADALLYQAKSAGRNQAYCQPFSSSEPNNEAQTASLTGAHACEQPHGLI